jgi:hypothetical protein
MFFVSNAFFVKIDQGIDALLSGESGGAGQPR